MAPTGYRASTMDDWPRRASCSDHQDTRDRECVTVKVFDVPRIVPQLKCCGAHALRRTFQRCGVDRIDATGFKSVRCTTISRRARAQNDASVEHLTDAEGSLRCGREACSRAIASVPTDRAPGVQAADILSLGTLAKIPAGLRSAPIRRTLRAYRDSSQVSLRVNRQCSDEHADIINSELRARP